MKTIIRRSLLLAFALFGLCFLCACQQGGQADGKIHITDVLGKEFTFDQPISKVVSTHNPTLNHVVVLGNGTSKYLAGFGNKDKADGLYSRILDDWNELTVIGSPGNPVNKETIIKLHPDLALVPENLSAMAEKDYEGTGVDTFIALPQNEKLETIPESSARIAKLFGAEAEERSRTVTDGSTKIVEDAYNAVKDVKDKPRVLFLGSGYKVATSDMIQTQIIEATGGQNAAAGQFDSGFFANTDAETIAKINPDVIYYANYSKHTKDEIMNDPKLASTNAVKSGKVYEFPCKLEPWDYPTFSTALGIAWSAHTLHPDLYSKDKLYKNCDDFYKLLYNKTFTPEELGLE
ncbi:MAG: ABC transporter substrate-binding protein [Coriobacteriia bacterium]|nr:ABC transporter substrate-binding protein [Coriobacteriia bacterium]